MESNQHKHHLFREEAMLKQHLADQHHNLFMILQPSAWLWLLIVCLILAGMVVWSCFGRVMIDVSGRGVILPYQHIVQIESNIKKAIKERKFRVDDLKHLMDKKRKLYLEKYITASDMQHAEDEYRLAQDDLLSAINKGIVNADTSPFSENYRKIEANQDLDAVIFISQQEGKKIHAGMSVSLLPDYLSAYQYGYIKGVVIRTSLYPVSKDVAYAYLGNMSLVDQFFLGSAPFMIQVKLENNQHNLSSLSWTTKDGAPFKIHSGTIVNSNIHLTETSPLSLIMKRSGLAV